MNALAATTASLAAGAGLVDIKKGLEKLRAVSGRLEVKTGISGARILDDTYNANPASVAVGLEVLREVFGERVLVLGDMAELGEAAAGIHQRIGALAKRVGVDRLFALGELSQYAVKSFGKGGRHFASHQALIEELMDCMHTDMTILIKGSRIMHMERVVQGILPRDPAGGEN
jgi:UDP-N-acetylmuramoyl-tripeptide--D-alanyl-D-alanine ligase